MDPRAVEGGYGESGETPERQFQMDPRAVEGSIRLISGTLLTSFRWTLVRLKGHHDPLPLQKRQVSDGPSCG